MTKAKNPEAIATTASDLEEKIFYKHLALVSWRGKYDPKIRVGAFLPLQWSEEMTDMENIEAALEGRQERKGLSSEEKNAINGMLLRAKYADNLIGGGLLVFNANSKVTRETLENYLNVLSPAELKTQAREARVY
jgi:hypothetical protein